jgi:aminoglycoside phosphotransferase (APT) family kinase protein
MRARYQTDVAEQEKVAERERIRAHVERMTNAKVEVLGLELLSGGACQENFKVDLDIGGERSTLVLRSDAGTALPGSIDRSREHAVIELAMSAGVKTPRARWLGKGLVRDGAYAYFLDWISGDAIGRKVTGAKELAAAREKLPRELGAELAKIHRVRPTKDPDVNGSARACEASFDPVQEAIAYMRKSIDSIHAPRPALELILRWLSENAPVKPEIVLVHGDFRTGNFMVAPDGLAAILDWEFARWGSRYEDLTWISMRDWRFNQLDLPIGGFGKREAFYEAYEKESGVTLDPKLLYYFEIAGNLNWAIGSVYQSERYIYGGESEFELVAIGRRACEMEHEALRLIEKGRL